MEIRTISMKQRCRSVKHGPDRKWLCPCDAASAAWSSVGRLLAIHVRALTVRSCDAPPLRSIASPARHSHEMQAPTQEHRALCGGGGYVAGAVVHGGAGDLEGGDMSCLRCDGCSRIIDTDFDVESYQEKTDRWLCEWCREELEEEENTETCGFCGRPFIPRKDNGECETCWANFH